MYESFTERILGKKWEIIVCSEDKEPRFNDCFGFTDRSVNKIAINGTVEGTIEDKEWFILKVLRHEIVHAFMQQAGLHMCYEESAHKDNEVIVDWFAMQWHDINEVIKDAEPKVLGIIRGGMKNEA